MTVLILTKQERNEYETKRLIESFQNKGIETTVCHPDQFDLVIQQDIKSSIKYNGETFEFPKIVLVRLGAGISPFQLSVIRQFEQANIPCINLSDSIDLVKDKLKTSQVLSKVGIAIPNTMLVRWPIEDKLVTENVPITGNSPTPIASLLPPFT